MNQNHNTPPSILDEYPFRPDEKYRITDADIEFQCNTDYEGIFQPPEPAEAYLEEGVNNYQYDRPLPNDVTDPLSVEEIETAHKNGYILPAPITLSFVEGDPEDDIPFTTSSKFKGRYMMLWKTLTVRGEETAIYRVITRWAVDAPDDYVLLIQEPVINIHDEMSVLPSIVDPSVGPGFLRVDIHIKDSGFTLRSGDPLAHIIPIPKDGLEFDMTFEPP